MKILITGANGQVGQALLTRAKDLNIEAFAYSKEMLDISSEKMVINILHCLQPHIVINAAAYTNVEQAEVFPEQAKKINADAVSILGRICYKLNIPLLHISTDYIFSGTKKTPYLETDKTSPLNVYGTTKLAGEKNILAFSKKFIILRVGWVFSATGNNFVKTMRRLFYERTDVSVVNDQWGAPTSASAVAQALLTIASQILQPNFNDWGIYHFSGDTKTTWYNFSCAIRDLCLQEPLKLQRLLPLSSEQFFTKATRPAYAVLDTKKIKHVFGIEPCNWQEDLNTVIQLLKKEEAR